jgi:hypothetical protein
MCDPQAHKASFIRASGQVGFDLRSYAVVEIVDESLGDGSGSPGQVD